MNERVVIAMSGGVDSSVAAVLLVEQGYEVIGLMLRLWAEVAPGVESVNKCCSLEAVEQARTVAHHLGIPFYLLNVERQFKEEVVEYFIDEYAAARTPNPCVRCNRRVRFPHLLRYADILEARYLATGHYARICGGVDGKWQLWRGVDRRKDQSYVLHTLGQAQLERLLFPLGEFTKVDVREMAQERHLPVAAREESQDLCFVADGDYREFLRRWCPALAEPGPIVDRQGRVLGEHDGLLFYTVGQRKGLGISATQPLYVIELRPRDNTLVVGFAEELGQEELLAGPVSWVAGEPPSGPIEVQVQIRYRAIPASATVIPLPGGEARARLSAPLRDITPGQSAVFYQGDVCLGGGPIKRIRGGR